MVVSNSFNFQPYLGKWSNFTNIFQTGWNHRLEKEQTKGAQHFSILPLAALKLDLVSNCNQNRANFVITQNPTDIFFF